MRSNDFPKWLAGGDGWLGSAFEHLSGYGQKVKADRALLLVHGNPWEVAKANGILQETRPVELHMHAETSADAHKIYPVE